MNKSTCTMNIITAQSAVVGLLLWRFLAGSAVANEITFIATDDLTTYTTDIGTRVSVIAGCDGKSAECSLELLPPASYPTSSLNRGTADGNETIYELNNDVNTLTESPTFTTINGLEQVAFFTITFTSDTDGGAPLASVGNPYPALTDAVTNSLSANVEWGSLPGATVTDNINWAVDATETVPEPSTWAMMLLGFAGLGFAGYRKARNALSIAA